MAFTDAIFQGPKQLSWLVSLPLVAWLGWRLWRFTLMPLLYPDEPKLLPYCIPVIGHTVAFFKSADKTLSYGRQYFGDIREPFAIVVAGATIYVITSATDATLVLKNIENLTFDEYVRDMMLRFGTSPAAVEAMWTHPASGERQNPKLTPNPMHKCLAHLQESIVKQQLLPGEKFQSLSDHFLAYISKAITWDHMSKKVVLSDSTSPSPGDGQQQHQRHRVVGLLEWTQEVLLDSATRTFFGDRLIDAEPELFQNFFCFDDNSWLFTYKIPKPWSRDMLAAKDVVQRALQTYFDLPRDQRPGASWMILSLEDEMRAVGIDSHDIAAMLNMIFWVVNGNAYKLCFWILAHLLHKPTLLSTIRTEISAAAVNANSPVHELSDRLDSCPHLDAVFYETLRLISSSMAVRNVATAMAVGGKTLHRGTKIIIPFRQLHFNESVWGSNAREFDLSRFLSPETQARPKTEAKEKAKQVRGAARDPNFRPFGGGTTICPGRFLARREVLAFVALAIVRFDLSLADGKGKGEGSREASFPRLEEGKPCLGLMAPEKGQNVFVKVAPRSAS